MAGYLAKALSVWLIGFFPLAEIYVAVPAGLAMGLDAISTVVWSTTGNIAPIVLLHYGYEALARIPRIGRWLERLSSPRLRETLDRKGGWFLLVATPWIGVWIVAASARLLGMRPDRILIYSAVSVVIYAIALTALITLGVDLARG
jgi:uncharacterized membrane protein